MKTVKSIISFSIILFISLFVFFGCAKKTASSNNTPDPIKTSNTQVMNTQTATPSPLPTTTVNDTPMVPLVPIETEITSSTSDASMNLNALPGGILKLKMENGEVKILQQRLKELGYLEKITGYFGTDTETAVKEFQKKNNLDADGIVGAGTWKIMNSSDAVSA